MSSKILFVTLGQLVDTDINRTTKAFSDLGIKSYHMLWQYGPLMKHIDLYKLGDITTTEFRTRINQLFNCEIAKADFLKAWNAMSVVTDESAQKFQDLLKLLDQKVEFRIVGNTNPIHWSSISQQLMEKGFTDQEIEKIKSRTTLSFANHALNELLLDKTLSIKSKGSMQKWMMLNLPISKAKFDWLNPFSIFSYLFLTLMQLRALWIFSSMKNKLQMLDVQVADWTYAGKNSESLMNALKRQNVIQEEQKPVKDPAPKPVIFSEASKAPEEKHTQTYELRDRSKIRRP